MRNSRGRFGLVPWIVSVAATVAAIGLGLFHKAVAFSQTDAAADGAPVVLELFTSEGCSSCPPADALITALGSSMESIIALAYHVDYWNHLGWADPFSSGRWFERQTDYARPLNLDGEYTPQMVIGGGGSAPVLTPEALGARWPLRARSLPGAARYPNQPHCCGVSKTSGQSQRAIC